MALLPKTAQPAATAPAVLVELTPIYCPSAPSAAPAPVPLLDQEGIPRSFAVVFAKNARCNPGIKSVFITGGDPTNHGMIVCFCGGTRHDYSTLNEIMVDVDAGLYKIVQARIPRC